MKIIKIIITCFFFITMMSCSTKITDYPPTYSQVMASEEAISKDIYDCSNFDSEVEIGFSKSDECKIYNEKNLTFVLASTIVTDSDWVWRRNISFIKPEKLSIKERSLYYQEIIMRDLYSWNNNIPTEKYDFRYYAGLADKLIELDSENSYPYYLKASIFYLFNEDINTILASIAKGNKYQTYNDYSSMKYQIIKDTALSLKYSPFTASYYAHMNIGYSYPIVPSTIKEISQKSVKETDKKICCIAGGIIERNGIFSLDIISGLSIQLEVCPEDIEVMERYKTLRKKISKINNLKVNDQNIEEKEYTELIENIYTIGEMVAYDVYWESHSDPKYSIPKSQD